MAVELAPVDKMNINEIARISSSEVDVAATYRLSDRARLMCSDLPTDCDLREFFDDETCRTAFALTFSSHSSKWMLVVEISKLGPYAKRYWVKRSWARLSYSDFVPEEAWQDIWRQVESLTMSIGLRLLTDEELETPLPEKMLFETPVGLAETVNDLLFYYDGRVV